ncbi:MAG: hypothetical protein K8H88_34155, partial [Sandaracinaceae bacterium]|nr:hypothetical protein [Sandaracinaceae bacterium]
LAAICEAEDLSLEDVWAADAAGPAGEEWPELVDLMRQAARRALARLLPAKQPILLVSPGLIERFGLTELLAALSGAGDARAERESEAVFLLVPTYDADAPRINDRMPIPNVMGLSETIPKDWLDNAHRSAAP